MPELQRERGVDPIHIGYAGFFVSHQQDNPEIDQLDQVNDELTRSLRTCHSIIDDYRSRFAANVNEPVAANEDESSQQEDDGGRLG